MNNIKTDINNNPVTKTKTILQDSMIETTL